MPPPPSKLLALDLQAHGGALRRLARGILGDAHAAEDVVQETWVQALERPPAHRDRIGGWLATITRSLALRRIRGDGRRRAREVCADASRDSARAAGSRPGGGGEGPVGASAADVAERRQALARLTSAVLALEEPYQSAILLRYYDDLPPREIARILDVPLATVKSRIARGIAQLRERVDHELAEDGTTLRRALAFLVGPAFPVAPLPTSATTGTVAGAQSGTLATLLAGGLAMGGTGKLIGGTAALVLVGLAAWQGLGRTAAEPVGPASAVATEDDQLVVNLQGAGGPGMTASAPEAERAAVEPSLAAPFEDATETAQADPFLYTLRGLVWNSDDLPAAHATVYVGTETGPRNLVGTTDVDGRFELSWRGRKPVTDVVVDVFGADGEASGLRRVSVQAGSNALVLQITPQQRSFFRASVAPSPMADGTLRLAYAESAESSARSWLVASVPQARPSWAPDLRRDADGEGRFSLLADRCPAGFSPQTNSFFTDLATTHVIDRSYERHVDILSYIAVVEDEAETPDFRFEGVVRGADGEPVPNALVVLGTAPGRADGGLTRTDAEGKFVLDAVATGTTWHARAGGGDHGRAETSFEAHDGGSGRWDPWLDRGHELRGVLVDAVTGEALSNWVVEVESPERADHATTDAEGRFEIPNLPRVGFALLARPAELAPGFARRVGPSLVPGGGDVMIEVARPEEVPNLRIPAHDEEGAPVIGGEARIWNRSTGRGVAFQANDGVFTLTQKLPADTFELDVLVPGRRPIHLGARHLAGADGVTLAPVSVERHGALALRDKSATPAAAEAWIVTLYERREDARHRIWEFTGALPPRLELPAGQYEIDFTPNPEDRAMAELLETGTAPETRTLRFPLAAGEARQVSAWFTRRAAAAAVVAPEPMEEPEAGADPESGGATIAEAEGTPVQVPDDDALPQLDATIWLQRDLLAAGDEADRLDYPAHVRAALTTFGQQANCSSCH